MSEYESIINGYINRQGLFDVNKNQIQNSIKQKLDSNHNVFENVGFTDDQNATPYISGSITDKRIFNKAVNNYLGILHRRGCYHQEILPFWKGFSAAFPCIR